MHGCGHDGPLLCFLAPQNTEEYGSIPKWTRCPYVWGRRRRTSEYRKSFWLIWQKRTWSLTPATPLMCVGTFPQENFPAARVLPCQAFYHFVLEINGKGGHGSRPDLAHSVIDCFHDIYSNLDTLRLKYIKPNTVLTWSLGSVNAGATFNLIPDKLTCEGSIRMMDRNSGEEFIKEFERIVAAICPLNYCTYQFKLLEQLLPTENYPACRKTYLDSIKKQIGEDVIYDCEPWMASETLQLYVQPVSRCRNLRGNKKWRIRFRR